MAINVKESFNEYVALNDEISDFIIYVSEQIQTDNSKETMVVMMQLQIKLFTAISELQTKQDWIIKKLKNFKADDNIPKTHWGAKCQ